MALDSPQGGGIKLTDVPVRLVVKVDEPFPPRCRQVLVNQSVIILGAIRGKHLRDWIALAVRLNTQVFG